MPPKRGGKKKDDKKDEGNKDSQEPEIPCGPVTYVVGGWSKLASLAEAAALAGGEDAVLVNSNVELTERLAIDKPLTIIGNGAPADRPNLAGGFTSTAAAATISNVRFSGPDSGCSVEKGRLAITDCLFEGATNLLSLYPYSEASVRDCHFSAPVKACVYCYPHSKGAVVGCTMRGGSNAAGTTAGVMMDNSAAKVENCSFEGLTTGAFVFSEGPLEKGEAAEVATVQGNSVRGCPGTGILLGPASRAVVARNEVEGSGYWGIDAMEGASVTLTGNTVADKVRIRKGALPVLQRNTFRAQLIDGNDRGTVSLEERY
ncbi:hypothetical protein DIPPA_31610 [Diplonema papillatum]|nr:hypothetical protein DIPPA_31610 [Diplonema papillatum]